MLVLVWIFVPLVVSLISGNPNHIQSHDLPVRTLSPPLAQQDANISGDHHATVSLLNPLLPRTTSPVQPSTPKIEKLSLSGVKEDTRYQAEFSRKPPPKDIPGPSSSISAKGAPASSNPVQAKVSSMADAGADQRKMTNPKSEQSKRKDLVSTPKPQKQQRRKKSGQSVLNLETAQANIAREPTNSLRGSSSPNRPSVRANEPMLADVPKKPSLIRLSEIDLGAVVSRHKTWVAGMDTDLAKAHVNARSRAAAGLTDIRAPPAIQKDLNRARAKAKASRDVAKIRIDTAANALYTRPASSPNTRLHMAHAHLASDDAIDDVKSYYNKERDASVTAAGHSRWRDFPKHLKKYARAVSRGSALESYNNALIAEYQSKLDREHVSKMQPDHPGREQAIKTAVDSTKDFNSAANLYYLRDDQYREVRQKYDGDSSEDERKSFASVPRKRS